MPIYFLLLLALARLRPAWPAPSGGLTTGDCTFLQVTIVLAFALAVLVVTHWFRALLLHDPSERFVLAHRFQSWKRFFLHALLIAFLLTTYLLGWGWTVRQLYPPAEEGARPVLLGFELFFLAPFLIGVLLFWTLLYDFDRLVHKLGEYDGQPTFPSRAGYVFFQAQNHFLLMLPPLIMILFEQLLFHLVPESTVAAESETLSWTLIGMTAGSLAMFVIGLPLFIRWFLRLTPMPAGPLRERLAEAARKLGLRYNNILIWHTRQTVANAMVTGILPWLRYVIITDRLVSEMSEEETLAVFGHEVGHIQHRHIAFYLFFLLASIYVFHNVWNLLTSYPLFARLAPWADDFTEIGILAGALYIFVVFGFISRRCEREADLFGARVASPWAFMNALEKVAILNGIPRENPGWLFSWQHSTIAKRVDFIGRTIDEPALAVRFQRRFGAFKWALALTLLGLGVALTLPL